jgi:hypothetical protein
MAGNQQIGSRLVIVDPNNFDDQYAGAAFGDSRYNMSVPLENLSISVELKTSSKARTVLTTQNNVSLSITDNAGTKNSSIVKVNFIDGTSDKTTGNQDNLTTRYTDLNTDLNDIEETLGINSIDIEFNSSYAPMIHINFTDIRGGAVFQNGGKSKYNVFFKLPYPLFELTIKGYYGKPVKYCLHMTKCNSKFNSQTGNFEIAASFVGYTYAMLSDMIIGYLKAAAETPRGKELLKARGVLSINEFLQKISNIDSLVKKQLLNSNDEDSNNLVLLNDVRQTLESMRQLVTSTVQFKFKYDKYEVPTPLNDSIVIIRDPNANGTPLNDVFPDSENNSIVSVFMRDITSLVTDYNSKVGTMTELQIATSDLAVRIMVTTPSSVKNNRPFVYDKIYESYGLNTNNTGQAELILARLKSASNNIANDNNSWVKYYDFTDILSLIDDKIAQLNDKQDELTKFVALKLKNLITRELGFDTSIRSIFELFTTHVEIFLQQIFEVSSKYKDNPLRTAELKKFVASKSTDISPNSSVIYPWPEYSENNKEKYLGSKSVLQNPLNVPEINFVEELYQGMLVSGIVEQNVNNTINDANKDTSWFGFAPADSGYYGNNKKPFDRLPDTATHDDVARLIALRATGLMGFSNNLLSADEIKNFAAEESKLILEKFKSADNKIINLLNANYDTPEKFLSITGVINNSARNVFVDEGSLVKYNYIYKENDYKILPVNSGFTNTTYVVPTTKDPNTQTEVGGFILSNLDSAFIPKGIDDASYIEIISKADYENNTVNVVPGVAQGTIQFAGLEPDITTPAQLNSAGFSLGNGSFGVQDFRKIQYNGFNSDSPFYTLFFNDGDLLSSRNQASGPVSSLINRGGVFNKSLLFPGFCQLRKATNGQNGQPFKTKWDIGENITLPYTIDNLQNEFNTATDTVSFGMIGSIYRDRKDIGRNISLLTNASNNLNNTIIGYPFVNFGVVTQTESNVTIQAQVSLFGSRFYNAQKTDLAKAFLFLHCLPWRGLVSQDPRNALFSNRLEIGVFRQTEILNVFQHRTGFVQVPKLWPAFIGGLIWRYRLGDGQDALINFKSDFNGEYLIPTFEEYSGKGLPKANQYMTQITAKDTMSSPMSFNATWNFGGADYADLEQELLNLPDSVQRNFMNEFSKFTQNEFQTIRKSLEVVPVNVISNSDESWVTAWNTINQDIVTTNTSASIPKNSLEFAFKSSSGERDLNKLFNVVSFIPPNDFYYNIFKYNFFLEYRDDEQSSPAVALKNLIGDYKYIINHSYLIWNSKYNSDTGYLAPITMNKSDFTTYINTIISNVKTTVAENQKGKFNNNELEEIKLEIYRTIKKIYDKWIGYSDNPNEVVFQCCKTSKDRLPTDSAINKMLGGDGSSLNLIDSFRFITRSFKDIGDEFQINPLIISKLLLDNTNISFYDLISRILTDNNFDFIALPSFINYNDPKELKDIFRPFPYYESSNIAAAGPSFVCVYIGQTSTKLDFGKDSEYPNDGFDLTGDPVILPPDFGVTKQPWEDVNAAFVVRYGQQNQNFFKDIILDQSEFSETAESLQITDNIANRLSDTNKSYVGQNLYNVYSVRSYKTEVEMLGDAMIQPMMYFQLENIPMFRGAYLITKVKHNIKPNHMLTTFTGTRIKAIETPIIDAAALYSALLDSFELPAASEGSSLTNSVSSVPPIVRTLINNGASNANVEQGNITLSNVVFPVGIQDTISDTPKLITEAILPLRAMLSEWVAWMKSNGYVGNNGAYARINSAFRSIGQQQIIHRNHPNASAPVGTSMHGWGVAIDFQFFTKTGNIISNFVNGKPNIEQGYNFNINESLVWLLDNSYRFGWIIPAKLRDGVGLEEFWHFEYHGTAAACILSKNPNVHGHIVSVDKPYDASVKNPRELNGTVAVYDSKNCDYTAIKVGDGSDVLSTQMSKQQLSDNQKIVKDFLKNYFMNTLRLDTALSQVLTAGVMGNIQKESGFNQTVKHLDTNGVYSYGLIQWNEGTYPNMFQSLGTTVVSQMTKLVDGYTSNFQKYVTQARQTTGIDAYAAAFLFAKVVEICAFCYKTIEIYNADRVYNQSDRSKYAEDFINRFNNSSDLLAW